MCSILLLLVQRSNEERTFFANYWRAVVGTIRVRMDCSGLFWTVLDSGLFWTDGATIVRYGAND